MRLGPTTTISTRAPDAGKITDFAMMAAGLDLLSDLGVLRRARTDRRAGGVGNSSGHVVRCNSHPLRVLRRRLLMDPKPKNRATEIGNLAVIAAMCWL